jgi:hypothetical protein
LIQIKPWRLGGDTLPSAASRAGEEPPLTDQLHPMTPHHLPFYIARPGETDWLMIAMGIFLIAAVLFIGNIYLRLHTLPDRLAHKSQKIQFEIVAVMCLISLFTHIHLLWIAALLLAMIDLPDFSTPLTRIAGSVEKIADAEDTSARDAAEAEQGTLPLDKPEPVAKKGAEVPKQEVRSHA